MKTFLFTDLEFSGLDINNNRPLEIAIIAADSGLSVIKTFHKVFFWESIVFNDWSEKAHSASGLINELEFGEDADNIDADICSFLRSFEGDLILAGQSVHVDRAWINAYLPRFGSKLNHRMLDLSTLDMILEDIGYAANLRPRSHRAEDDARAALNSARHYRKSIKYDSSL